MDLLKPGGGEAAGSSGAAPPRGCLFLRRRSPKPRLSPAESHPALPDGAAGAPGVREEPARFEVQPGSDALRARVRVDLNGRIEIGGEGGEQILKPELLPGPCARDMRRER